VDTIFPEVILTLLVASLLTFFDLDAVFDAPPRGLAWSRWLHLQTYWWGFILANGLLATFLYCILKDKENLKDLNPWLVALLIGAGYSALIRLKFTTLAHGPDNTPLGLETLYEGLKGVIHRRINRIVREWRIEQAAELSKQELPELRQRALIMIEADSLLTEDQRAKSRKWVVDTAADESNPLIDRKRTLAVFIIQGRLITPSR
jgi:hypothetical protein